MREEVEVKDTEKDVKKAEVSRYVELSVPAGCGFVDEWQPGILHGVKIHNMHPHSHEDFEEIFLILEGSGTIYLGGTPIRVNKWDTVKVPKKVVHEAVPDKGSELIVAVYGKWRRPKSGKP